MDTDIMNKTYHISSLEEVEKTYYEVLKNFNIKAYRCIGGGRYSLGFDPVTRKVIKREGEYYFDNPNYVPAVPGAEEPEPVDEHLNIDVDDMVEAEDNTEEIKPSVAEDHENHEETIAALKEKNAALSEELDTVKKQNEILSRDIENIMITVRTIKNLFANVDHFNFK